MIQELLVLNSNNKLRCGECIVTINEKQYIIPYNAKRFKSYDNKDCYLSGIENKSLNRFKPNYIATIKFIEEDKYEEVPMDKLQKYL